MNDTMSVIPQEQKDQEQYLAAEAAKIGISVDDLKTRIKLVNDTSNTFGQLALQLTEGNWDVALSISATFFASTLAQTALHTGRDYKELWDFVIPGVEDTARVLYEAFAEAQRQLQSAAAETVQGVANQSQS